MFHAMYGQFEHEFKRRHLNGARQEHYLKWARPYHRTVGEKVSHVPGRIYHLWHGKILNRDYRGRARSLASFDFDPEIDLRLGANGAWQWARPRPDLEKRFLIFTLSLWAINGRLPEPSFCWEAAIKSDG
jgi:hypothetical protein